MKKTIELQLMSLTTINFLNNCLQHILLFHLFPSFVYYLPVALAQLCGYLWVASICASKNYLSQRKLRK